MIAKPVWVVMRPVSKTKLVAKAAYFSKGAARNACIPNYADYINEAVLLLDVPEKMCGHLAVRSLIVSSAFFGKSEVRDGDRCNLPSRKPAAKKKAKRDAHYGECVFWKDKRMCSCKQHEARMWKKPAAKKPAKRRKR